MMSSDDEHRSGNSGASQVPATRPSIRQWLQGHFNLPFELPHIPLVRTAANLDKAAARLLGAASENIAARIERSTERVRAGKKGIAAVANRGSMVIEGSASDELDARALEYVLENARIEQGNRERVLELTAEELKHNSPTADASADIEPDWLNMFARLAGEKSDADVQSLWARILAGEIRAPGTVRLRTLARLATYERRDAVAAHAIMELVFLDHFLLADYFHDDLHNDRYSLLLEAQDLDLVGGQLSELTQERDAGSVVPFPVSNKVLLTSTAEKRSLRLGVYILTTFGQDLLKLATRQQPPGAYLDHLIAQIKGRGFTVRVGDLVSSEGGQLRVHNLRDA
jgi:Protein of unknown function (DUF2806)